MFRPDRADLFVCREFAPIGLRHGFGKRGFLLDAQFIGRLIAPRQLQKHAAEFILHLGRQASDGLDSLFE